MGNSAFWVGDVDLKRNKSILSRFIFRKNSTVTTETEQQPERV